MSFKTLYISLLWRNRSYLGLLGFISVHPLFANRLQMIQAFYVILTNKIMATTIKITIDTRRVKADGKFPIYLRLIHNREARNIPTNISASLTEWNESNKEVKSSFPNSARVNFHLKKRLTDAQKIILQNEERLNELSIDDLKALLIVNEEKPKLVERGSVDFFKYGTRCVDRLKLAKRFGSATSYNCCIVSIRDFVKADELPLEEITYKFLIDYESHCLGKELKINSIGNYLRSLRAIINLAIDEGLLKMDQYPFRKYRIKKEETVKRAIPKNDIKALIDHDLEVGTRLWNQRNYFTFMFNMRGMNFIDLAFLTMNNIISDRVIYKRIKTNKQYNIKITQQALKILNYYTVGKAPMSDELIFPILRPQASRKDEKDFDNYKEQRKRFNNDMKELAKLCGIAVNFTSYVTRHSWASIAKFSRIDTSIIKESLGHSDSKTTETYLANFEQNILDDANEIILS
ncbi:MAG: site-specific integrase [Bacteroidia bacterium]|nr:site-specific integrase [Bacteroidia bacterium]